MIYLILYFSEMDENSEGKRKFNECMDKGDTKNCRSINVKGNDKGF